MNGKKQNFAEVSPYASIYAKASMDKKEASGDRSNFRKVDKIRRNCQTIWN